MAMEAQNELKDLKNTIENLEMSNEQQNVENTELQKHNKILKTQVKQLNEEADNFEILKEYNKQLEDQLLAEQRKNCEAEE